MGSANNLVNVMNTMGKWQAGATSVVAVAIFTVAIIVFVSDMFFPGKQENARKRARGNAWIALGVAVACLAYAAFNYFIYTSNSRWVRSYRAVGILGTVTSQVF